MTDTADPETLVVFSDYVCPFCYLGRASLRRYQESREEPVPIEWHPFDLRARKRGPDGSIDPTVDDGKDEAYYEQARQNVHRLQEEYDVEMATALATDVDSLPAQVASFYVQHEHPDRWPDFDEAIFGALWVEGRDIGDRDVLADLAADVGLDATEVREAIDDPDWLERVTERFEAAHRRGVTGVPTFVYGRYAARGAVPPAQLERLVEG